MSDDDIQVLLLAAGHKPGTPIDAETLRSYSEHLLARPRIGDEVARVAAEELSVLTQAQRTCLILTGKGLSQVEIGAQLGTSAKTVGQHMWNMHHATDMTTMELVVLACKAGWL